LTGFFNSGELQIFDITQFFYRVISVLNKAPYIGEEIKRIGTTSSARLREAAGTSFFPAGDVPIAFEQVSAYKIPFFPSWIFS
jgi:hypothetical protein